MAKGIAMKTSPMPISQKWMNHPLSVVGKKALLVGSVLKSTSRIFPMWTKPVQNMTVRGVP